MKRNIMMLALASLTMGAALNADEVQSQNEATASQKTQVVTTSATPKAMENAAVKLSVEEQAFVAKLADQNRKTFSDKFSADQRKAVMVAVKNGANADEAVQRMLAAKELKETSSVANAEKEDSATSETK